MPIHKVEKRDVTVTMVDFDCSELSFCMEHGPFPSDWSIHNHNVEEKDGKAYVTWGRYVGPYHIETAQVEAVPPAAKEVERA